MLANVAVLESGWCDHASSYNIYPHIKHIFLKTISYAPVTFTPIFQLLFMNKSSRILKLDMTKSFTVISFSEGHSNSDSIIFVRILMRTLNEGCGVNSA